MTFIVLFKYGSDKVRKYLFPNSEIEIFIDFCRYSTNFPNFQNTLSDNQLGLTYFFTFPENIKMNFLLRNVRKKKFDKTNEAV